MLGWLADSFRLVWGLLYWNARKTAFRLRRGRSPCPCQSPSDSGRAYETRCDACIAWHKPRRFRRVCPLLVETPEGLRCSADTADVRPFWGRAFGIYGGVAAAGYGAAVFAVFIFLRTIGYPVSIVEVGFPPYWDRLAHARGWFFFERSQRAFAAGRSSEGLLYLSNAYEFDPSNYKIGITLAKNYQVGQPAHSDRVFEQLLRDHPAHREAIAQDWFRALLARGNFEKVSELARQQVLTDPDHAHVWLRALFLAVKLRRVDEPLRELRANDHPAAVVWHPLIDLELLIRNGRTTEALAALKREWPAPPGTRPVVQQFTLVYRVDRLIELRDTFAALDLLQSSAGRIDDEAHITLLLDAYATARAERPLRIEVEQLLAQPMTLATIKVLCAQLIRHPNRDLFAQLCARLERETIPLDSASAGIWFSLLCTAGAVDDTERLQTFTQRLKHASATPFYALGVVEAFFRGQTAQRRITSVLPFLPLPLEVTYALLERYPPPPDGLSLDLTASPAPRP